MTRPRALPARKAQALLAYLAVRAGRAHARETLTGLFWGDVGERQARQSLRQTMVRLRRALAGSPRALVAQGDTVTLTPPRSSSTSRRSSAWCSAGRRRRWSRRWRSITVRCSIG